MMPDIGHLFKSDHDAIQRSESQICASSNTTLWVKTPSDLIRLLQLVSLSISASVSWAIILLLSVPVFYWLERPETV